MPREHTVQCWSCLGEFDAAAAVWCTCSALTPTKLCPFCFHCFCQADIEYQEAFWNAAPDEMKEERGMLKNAAGSIGESLVRSNLLNTGQLVSALRWQKSKGGTIEGAIVDLGLATRENVDLVGRGKTPESSRIDLSKVLVDASLVAAIGVELAFRKRVLPVSREEIGEKAVLTLAMAGPTDVETIDQIQTLSGCTVIPMSAPEPEILQRLKDLFPDEIAALDRADQGGEPVRLSPQRPRAPARPAAVADDAPGPVPSPARAAPAPPARRRAAPRGGAAAAPSILEESEALGSDADPLALQDPPPSSVPDTSPVPAPAAAPAAAGAAADPGAAVLQKILAEAIGKRASGIQIERRGGDLSLFFRIDGILYRARVPALQTPGSLPAAVAARAGLPAEGAAAGRMTVRAGERRIDVVVRRLPAPGAESLLLKLLERSDFVRPLDGLGASRADLKRLLQALEQPRGLVLLSGPPHNGVESTRYSLMAHLAAGGRRVSSIESPLWLPVEGARQEEVPFPAEPERARAAAAGLAGTELLFLPEIQTPALATLAVEQAASCLVVAPLQARRASHAPAALLWYRVDPQALASVLRLVVSQRLVRRLCDGCRAATPAADHVLKMMGLTPDEALDLTIYQGSGCERCGPLSPGSIGRVALYEVMEATPEIGTILAAGGQPGEIEREARRAGMSPLRAACLALVGQGITSLEEFQKGNF